VQGGHPDRRHPVQGLHAGGVTVASACSGPAPLGAPARTSLPLARDLRLWRTGSRLAQRGSTASLVPRALSLPRRAPPPLWETPRAADEGYRSACDLEAPSALTRTGLQECGRREAKGTRREAKTRRRPRSRPLHYRLSTVDYRLSATESPRTRTGRPRYPSAAWSSRPPSRERRRLDRRRRSRNRCEGKLCTRQFSAEHNSDFEGPAANASGPGLADKAQVTVRAPAAGPPPAGGDEGFGLSSGVELSRRRSRSDRPRRKPRTDAGATVYAAIAITQPPRLVTGFGETP